MVSMRRRVLQACALGSMLSVSAAAFAQPAAPAKKTAARAQAVKTATPPPLIDRELFFGNPEISGAQLSPDGKYISFIKPWNDTRNIWVKKAGEPFEAARRVTAEKKRPIPGYFWSRDSKYILFVQDKDGDENYNVYAVNPSDAPAGADEVPAARNLTDAKGARAMIYAVPKKMPDVMFVGLNDRDAAWHDVYKVQISTGQRTLVRKNTDKIAAWTFDLDGNLRLATRVADNGDSEILRIDGDRMEKIYGCTVLETCAVFRFEKDGKRVYGVSNKGDRDLAALVLIDAMTGKEEVVESDPKNRVDFGSPIFSDKTDELVGTAYEDERVRVYFRDKTWEADYNLLKKRFPNTDISESTTADERLWLVGISSDTEPGARYLFDRATRKITFQYRVFEKLDRKYLAPMKAVTFTSSDGLAIPAFLTLPKGVDPTNLPAMLVPHGGPWARDGWGYDAFAQFLANRGYAVLQPNFRGSTGYGKKFLNAGNLQWGDKMQDDITWGAKYLVARGIADPKRVGIMGGSYGGYATLAGVAFTPDLYAAAVDIVGPSNLSTLMETIPPYWEAARKMFYERMGNPTTADGKKQLDRQSPLFSAEKIQTPLMVVQGANDPRVKKAESDQIVIALRDRGFPVQYLVADDEGHGFARPVNNMAMFAAAEKFLAKYLGGRCQEDMKPEVSARLNQISVDPKTVVLAKKIDPKSVTAPKPVRDLAPMTAEYVAKFQGGGQTATFGTTLSIKEDAGGWIAVETAKTPMGEAVDTTTIEKGTLLVTKRSIKQGPSTVDLVFANNKATGTFAMSGQSKQVDADLGGPIFADGAGTYAVLAMLPLENDFVAHFRNFDLQRQKASIKRVAVTGTEDVTVAAGTFKAQKLEITSAEGEPGKTTVWVDPETHKVVKILATLTQMPGATITMELQK